MTTPIHFLIYIKRHVGNGHGIPLDSLTAADAAKLPMAHGFNYEPLFRLAQSGQPITIWLFSVMRYQHWCMPPSLDGCIQVGAAHRFVPSLPGSPYIAHLLERFKFAVDAMPGSCYFPWNDFGPILPRLLPLNNWPKTTTQVLPFSDFAKPLQSFQTPRRLDSAAVAILQAYKQQLSAMPSGFISYRHKEAAMLAMQTAAFLYAHGVTPWWDQWAMPREVAEEHAICDPGVMDQLISAAIEKASLAVTIQTESYATDTASWTKLELAHILQASKKRGLIHCPIKPPSLTELEPDRIMAIVASQLGENLPFQIESSNKHNQPTSKK